MTKPINVNVSSGNLYADLGFANPELEQAKADLAREIRSNIELRRLTQVEAAELLGIDQADVSRITRGRLGGFSLERLITFLTRLSLDIGIQVRPTVGQANGHLTVERASDRIHAALPVPDAESIERKRPVDALR
jgi:predicted XRE-type DNA-binding protein